MLGTPVEELSPGAAAGAAAAGADGITPRAEGVDACPSKIGSLPWSSVGLGPALDARLLRVLYDDISANGEASPLCYSNHHTVPDWLITGRPPGN